MNITVLGHVCIDHNSSENSIYTAAGGSAVFINKIFSQIPDVTVKIIAPFGSDFLEFKKNLPLLGSKIESLKTLIYKNVSKNDTRTQKALNREFAVPPELISKTLDILKDTDILFVAPLLPNFSSLYLESVVSSVKQNCLKVLLPQGFFRDFDDEDNVILRDFMEENITSLFDLVIVSEQDSKNMLPTAHNWAQKYRTIVVVTLGNSGAIAVTEKGVIALPTNPVMEDKVVDSVGSGDIFAAAFSYKYYLTHNIEESGRFANEIARQCLFFTPDEIKITV